MTRTFRPSLSPSIVATAAALLASVFRNAGASASTTYTAELYLDLDPSGVDNAGEYDFVGLGTTPSGFVPAVFYFM